VDQTDLLNRLLDVVEAQRLPYAIAGSHATMAYGESRMTNDIDIVIDLSPTTLGAFCDAFPFPEFYVSEDGARVAASKGGMFNIINAEAGLKIDVIVPESTFDRSHLARVVRAPAIGGRIASFVAPEDVILKKMQAFEEGGSEKHLRDIGGVLRTMGSRIDRRYIRDWAQHLGVAEVWKKIAEQVPERAEGTE
jgi:hypothetical protein